MELSHLKRAVLRHGDKSNPRSGCPSQVTCSLCQLQCRSRAQAPRPPGLSQAHPLLQSEIYLQEKDPSLNSLRPVHQKSSVLLGQSMPWNQGPGALCPSCCAEHWNPNAAPWAVCPDWPRTFMPASAHVILQHCLEGL